MRVEVSCGVRALMKGDRRNLDSAHHCHMIIQKDFGLGDPGSSPP